MVDHVRRETGYDKVAFIGHSQGNATMFCSLGEFNLPFLEVLALKIFSFFVVDSARDGAGAGRKAVDIYRIGSCCLCWTTDNWIPFRRSEKHEVEDLASMVW